MGPVTVVYLAIARAHSCRTKTEHKNLVVILLGRDNFIFYASQTASQADGGCESARLGKMFVLAYSYAEERLAQSRKILHTDGQDTSWASTGFNF